MTKEREDKLKICAGKENVGDWRKWNEEDDFHKNVSRKNTVVMV